MVDTDTFLTTLYVQVDTFCKQHGPAESPMPGAKPSLCSSEVVTLAIFGQWAQFRSERDFYRFADRHLRAAFPSLPDRSQFNRLLRQHREIIMAFSLDLTAALHQPTDIYEAVDSLGVPTRHAKRRGAGWMDGLSGLGWSNRLGWYHGFHVLTAVTPQGVITGYGFAPGNTSDQELTETFLAVRDTPTPALHSVGQTRSRVYIVDKGFEGVKRRQRWAQAYGVQVICAPRKHSQHPWSKEWRRWLARQRQIVETVHDKLTHAFRLDTERPHELAGFQARLGAKMALHNFCIWLNQQLGRDLLAFADLIDW